MIDTATPPSETDTLHDLTTQIVAAYISNNTLPADALPGLISTVFQALSSLGQVTTETLDLAG